MLKIPTENQAPPLRQDKSDLLISLLIVYAY